MQARSKAELFIKTLRELLDAEREMRRADLLRQRKARAERYKQILPAEFDEPRAHLGWAAPRNEQRLHASGKAEPH